MNRISALIGASALAVGIYAGYTHFFASPHFGSTEPVVAALRANLENPQTSDLSPAIAAQNMIAALDPNATTELVQVLDSKNRTRWSNLPAGIFNGRSGAKLGDLDEAGNAAVWDFLRAALSQKGLQEITKIVLADKILGETDGASRWGWGSDNFWISIYGTPSETGAWAWQFGGHHLALNVSVNGSEMILSPFFFGTEPANFEENGIQHNAMGNVPATALTFMQLLDASQRDAAIVSERPEEVYAGAGKDDVIPQQQGLLIDALDGPQAKALEQLILEFVGVMPEPAAIKRMAAIRTEFPQSYFSWHGATDGSSSIYFQFQSPSALIEFSTQGAIGADAGHYHAIYRNLSDDYGRSLLNQ